MTWEELINSVIDGAVASHFENLGYSPSAEERDIYKRNLIQRVYEDLTKRMENDLLKGEGDES